MYSYEVIEYVKSKEESLDSLCYRIHEPEDVRQEGRNEFMRDYARVLYSSSFRRLQGKMQLFGVDSKKFNRNRLTHSLEVAQIARTIAASMGMKETSVVETAALAHDIGNPPFGHSGEATLNKLVSMNGGYEGNAQTLRILRTLEKKHPEYSGLNLNVRTLLSVIKYFNKHEGVNKKFLYDEDYDAMKDELSKFDLGLEKSIDAEIMDLSDEIAYAAHDLEDALSFGLVTIDEIVHEFYIDSEFSDAYDKIVEITGSARTIAQNARTSSEEYFVVLKKEITGSIVHTLCKDIGLVNGCLGYKEYGKLANGLKKLLFRAVLRKKDIQLYEKMGERVIKGLFDVYIDESFNRGNKLLPVELRGLQCDNKRLVVDYISGMMDSFAIQEFERYYGSGSAEKLYR